MHAKLYIYRCNKCNVHVFQVRLGAHVHYFIPPWANEMANSLQLNSLYRIWGGQNRDEGGNCYAHAIAFIGHVIRDADITVRTPGPPVIPRDACERWDLTVPGQRVSITTQLNEM